MSDCQCCGMPCMGRWCSSCEVEETAPDLTPSEDYECPHCGGTTSGEGVTCKDCRRVGDILDEEMDGRSPDDSEDAEVSA